MQGDATDTDSQTGVQPYKSVALDAYISWKALGGLVINEEWEDPATGKLITNKIRQMPFAEFCTTYQVDRATVWRWRKGIPDLASRIRERRAEIVPLAQESEVYKHLFLLCIQAQDKRAAVEAIKLWGGHFGDLHLPVQRQELEIKANANDLLMAAKDSGIIEGELADATDHTGTDGEDPRSLPTAS